MLARRRFAFLNTSSEELDPFWYLQRSRLHAKRHTASAPPSSAARIKPVLTWPVHTTCISVSDAPRLRVIETSSIFEDPMEALHTIAVTEGLLRDDRFALAPFVRLPRFFTARFIF
jgi:hypothetical protein